jgi:hypothetical protein
MAEALRLDGAGQLLEDMEATILKVTLETPNGGSCRIGGASFTVRYCSDIWEWEYEGETFWDALDLALAMVQGSQEPHQQLLPWPPAFQVKESFPL